jgi:hypothetical protein
MEAGMLMLSSYQHGLGTTVSLWGLHVKAKQSKICSRWIWVRVLTSENLWALFKNSIPAETPQADGSQNDLAESRSQPKHWDHNPPPNLKRIKTGPYLLTGSRDQFCMHDVIEGRN